MSKNSAERGTVIPLHRADGDAVVHEAEIVDEQPMPAPRRAFSTRRLPRISDERRQRMADGAVRGSRRVQVGARNTAHAARNPSSRLRRNTGRAAYGLAAMAGPLIGVYASWEQYQRWVHAAEHREGGTHYGAPIPERLQLQQREQERRQNMVARRVRALVSKPAAVLYGIVTALHLPAALDWTQHGWPESAYGQVIAWIDVSVAGGAFGLVTVTGWVWLRRLALRRRARRRVGTITENGAELEVRPISEAPHETAALELLRRSLVAQGIDTNAVTGRRTSWGWELEMQIVGGSGKRPADVINRLEHIETDLDVRQNGVLVQPHVGRRARFTTRVVESDPWAQMPPLPVARPGQRSIHDPIELGLRMDGQVMSASYAATHAIILAASGGGKSGLIRAIVDGLIQARDVILWDIDPSGVGQAPQAVAMERRALSPEDAEDALTLAVQIAEARTRILSQVGMGDEWQPSAQYPALLLILDEYPRLTREAKDAAVALLRIARKAGVVLVFASQSAKKDSLGDSVAGEIAFKCAGPGLADYQTRLLFGDKAIAEGYTPGAYRPKRGNRLNDTGTFFLEGCIEGDEPIPTRALWYDNEVAARRAEAAVQAGRPVWDTATLQAAGLSLSEVSEVTSADDAAAARRAAFDDEQAYARLGILGQVAEYLAADLEAHAAGVADRSAVSSAELVHALGARSGRTLATDLGAHGLQPGQVRLPDEDGAMHQVRGYRFADITAAVQRATGGAEVAPAQS